VVVFGWSPHVTGFVLCLLNWAERVTVVTDGRRLQVDRRHRQLLEENGVEVVEDDATELVGASGQLRGVRLRSGATIPCGMAFFSIVHRPVTDLADRLGCARDDDGYVVVDDSGCTTVPGVYAAGDLVPGLQLVQVAAAKGTTAGVGCALSLQAVLLEAEAIAEE
jgi:thioredoxin reductase